MDAERHPLNGSEVAIVGMSCRFPGASTLEQFWRNLVNGAESLSLLDDDELLRAGVDPATLSSPNYVRRVPVLEGIELFDAGFFGYTAREAELMDPQQRLFLECAWEALEHAGYDPLAYERSIGVFTGGKTNTYLFNIFTNQEVFRALDTFQIALGNDLAAMATRVSYKLDLRGPSYALHTACSTSLVAVHLACQSLLLDECQMALAGGAAINVPQRRGYLYQPGGILSPDGSCRTFDSRAAGSNFGNGVGVVVLKRLEDALTDGDHIHAVVKGSATNNDGARKASFTAPGVEGQAGVVLEALACAGVEPETISYLEAHGTATDLGDSIEMLALTEAFAAATRREGFCAIGSVKTNVGHLETAAGIAGLIKTALALEHRQIPPSLHFTAPNPKIDFAAGPFFVNTELRPWERGETPRRAGISSFGIGSTNAHAVLEEAPEVAASGPARPWQLLLLSARSDTALDTAGAELARHLREHPDLRLADAAYTLQVGRRSFAHRRAVLCREPSDAVAALEALDAARVSAGVHEGADRPVAFLLPGLGDGVLQLARGLYDHEEVFRRTVDDCAARLLPRLGLDLREVIYPGEAPAPPVDSRSDLRRLLGRGGEVSAEAARLSRTWLAQPALFVVEYALARTWTEWGIRPHALLGYSLGEYVAACLAGVFSLDDALLLVAERARLLDGLPPGAMLAVSLGEEKLAPRLGRELSLAAVNGPGLAVAAGPEGAVAALADELVAAGIAARRLSTTHAFHSRSMEAAAPAVAELFRTVTLSPPSVPYLSNLSGTWIRPEEATDPAYWARHLVSPVRFAAGARELLADPRRVLLEMGSGQSLAAFVKLHPDCGAERARSVLAALPGPHDRLPDDAFLTSVLGRLWVQGVRADWRAYHRGERRLRVPLPTYPFERQRYWIEAGTALARRGQVTLEKQADPADWLYAPAWEPAPRPAAQPADGDWLVVGDPDGLGNALLRALRHDGEEAFLAVAGSRLAWTGEREVAFDLASAAEHAALLEELRRRGRRLCRIVFLAGAARPPQEGSTDLPGHPAFCSLLAMAQGLGRTGTAPVDVAVVTRGVHRVVGDEELWPENATVLGLCKVIPKEFARVTSRGIDIAVGPGGAEGAVAELLQELRAPGDDDELVALRDGERWVQVFRKLAAGASGGAGKLRRRGVYLITGGLGGLGLALAEHLATRYAARLVLTRRSPFPEREAWEDWLATHSGSEQDEVAATIRRLRRLEELGAEVLAASADAGDRARMEEVRRRALERFGALHGVIHLAGIPGGGIIQLKTPEMAARILAPKVQGAITLAEVLRDEPLDFVVFFSSIASILGEFGQADYCGANAFLDALAQSRAARGGPLTLAINWDIWREVGLAVETEVPVHLRAWRQEMLEKAIHPREGVEVFERVLGCGLCQVVVSAQDLHGRIELGKAFTGERFLEELGRSQGSAAPAAPPSTGLPAAAVPAQGLERRVAEVWRRLLGRDQVGPDENFFDIGGNSLVALQLVNDLNRELGTQLTSVDLFESPTVAALTRRIAPAAPAAGPAPSRRAASAGAREPIAVVGMAGRFPGACNLAEYWENLRAGRETITRFTAEELIAAGEDPELVHDPAYVKAASIIDGIDLFDAGLFGYSPREAEVMDPQHRVFLECAWEALEHAGYDTETYGGAVGVFAGSNLSTYLLQLYADPDVKASVNLLQAILGNDKDSLTTTVSYKLNLRGPSIAVQTFCSTSLVAVHLACRSLRAGECDMALAGGVRVVVPQRRGYLYEQGGLAPSDGHARSFDAKANGSVLGEGVGVVCLKRLADALADGDAIHAVIRGSAINNDGSLKAGYTAPSIAGQAEAIAAALEDAGVRPEELTYVEAHGSATELGDPIEVTALTRAFRRWSDRSGWCAIGSVKSNFGHLDRAAGVAGLIKAVLALEHGEIPPSINFDEPNPRIDFAGSPFHVQTALGEWRANGAPRRAAVNSLGMGGTNAHVIVEEAPPPQPSDPSGPWQLLVLSAKSEAALESVTANLASHLESHPDLELADVAHTLQVGRRALDYGRTLVCRDLADAVAGLRATSPQRALTSFREKGERPVIFLFSGLGGQYVGMGRGLYETQPTFRAEVDRCAEILRPHLGLDLREVLFPLRQDGSGAAAPAGGVDLRKMLRRNGGEEDDEAARRLNRTSLVQPALFVLELALARLWAEWGVHPRAMIGYSLGEYVAACLAGVMEPEDALRLVALRAQRIDELPPGAMLAVGLPEAAVRLRLGDDLSLAAVNGPEQSVVAGPCAAAEALERELEAEGVACRRLQAAHAFHSRWMQPAFEPLVELARTISFRPPRTPYLSNVTGGWIEPEQATDPTYWARHMCEPVRFSEGVTELLADPDAVLLEIGPGQTLASLVLQHPASRSRGREAAVLGSLPHSYETVPDLCMLLRTVGKLWLTGAPIDWAGLHRHERRRRVVLPTYPFERQRYWIESADGRAGRWGSAGRASWLHRLAWRRAEPLTPTATADGSWLVFADRAGIGAEVAERLARSGRDVVTVEMSAPGEGLARTPGGGFRLAPDSRPEAYVELLAALGGRPDHVVHAWGIGARRDGAAEEPAFASLTALARALQARDGSTPPMVWALSDGLHPVTGEEAVELGKAALLGACWTLSHELGCRCRSLDVVVSPRRRERLLEQVLAELATDAADGIVAYRGPYRWVLGLEPLAGGAPARPPRNGGAYLVVRGLSGPGRALAHHLARTARARLLLIEPPGFPEREDWDAWLESDGGGGLVARRILAVRELEETAAEVLVVAADPADEAQMRRALALARERFGVLDGWIYCAGGCAVGDGELGTAASRLQAEELALALLDELARAAPPAAGLLVSPSAPAEGPGSAVAAAVGFTLEAAAAWSLQGGGRWASVVWDLPEGAADVPDGVLDRLFTLPPGAQAVLSPRRLAAGWTRLEATAPVDAAPARAEAVGSYARPRLRVDYVAPRNATEAAIAAIWEGLLGVAQVGVHDHFLDLGGDSLLATRLVARMRAELGVDLPVRVFFERSTVAELAEAVDEARREDERRDTAALLSRIQSLSEEELEMEIMRLEGLAGHEEAAHG
jgi:acyl transferase domain-containing protein/acyl carrier protein